MDDWWERTIWESTIVQTTDIIFEGSSSLASKDTQNQYKNS